MNHPVNVVLILDGPLLNRPQRQHMHAVLRQMDEVLVLVQKYSHALALPELETLVSENNELIVICGDVHANDVVRVHENGLVGYDELLQTGVNTSQNNHVWITDIQFVLPFDQKFEFCRIVLVNFDNEES